MIGMIWFGLGMLSAVAFLKYGDLKEYLKQREIANTDKNYITLKTKRRRK